MQITIQGSTVTVNDNIVGYRFDNGVDVITLVVLDSEGNPDTSTPEDQQPTYAMIVYMTLSKTYQIIQFTGTYPILTATLTSEQLPVNGRYIGQFEIALGDKISHSQQFDFWVEDTLNPNDVQIKTPTIN